MKNFHILYTDLDGVYSNFRGGVMSLMTRAFSDINAQPPSMHYQLRLLKSQFYDVKTFEDIERHKELRRLMYDLIIIDDYFWLNLPPLDGAIDFFKSMAHYEPVILTSPIDSDPKCRAQKIHWVKENLNIPSERVIVHRDKYLWSKAESGTPNLLIDDTLKKVKGFIDAGGYSILHTDYAKTLSELKEYHQV